MESETYGRKDLKVNRIAISDWGKCESLVIVYPQKLPGRSQLIKFYNKFIKTLPEDLKLTIIVKDNEVEKHVNASFPKRNIETFIIQDVTDIWIRDWAPITIIEKDIKKPIKLIYRPSYFNKKDLHYADSDNHAGKIIGELLVQGEGELVDLIWDGGNLTHNGKGIAIVSNRLISDNETRNIRELKEIIHVFLGFRDIIFIPVESGDETGHVDGMVRFLDEKTLVVGTYPDNYKTAPFMNRLAENLHKELGPEFKIIRLLNSEPEDVVKEGIASAVGNHVNFLRLEDKIYFPYYSDEISGDSLKGFISELKRLELDIKVLPVNIPEINDLAKLGGVLNCITWQLLQ